jgi:sodium/proline symporter
MPLLVGLGVLILSIICLIDLPFARRVNTNLGGFFLMNGRLKLPGFVASILSANLSIGNFLVFIAYWGYAYGWGGIFWFLVNLGLNVVAYLVFIPAFRAYIEDRNNSGTIHDFLATTFGKNGTASDYSRRIKLIASATTILGLLFAIVFELHLATAIIAPLLGVDAVLIFSLLTALICIYSGVGGFHTLVFTDIMQSFAMIIGTLAVVPILWMIRGWSTTAPLTAEYHFNISSLGIGWPSILGICVIGSGWFLVAMDQWQRTCATRDSNRTRLGMLWYLASISGFAIIYGLLGMYDKTGILPALSGPSAAQHSQGANPLTDFFLAANVSDIHPYLFALVAVALLAAAMSTANTFLIVCGHSFVSDLLIAVVKKDSMHNLSDKEDRAFLGIARGSIIGMGVFVILTWIILSSSGLLSDPLSFFFIAYSIQFALLAPMVFSRFPKTQWPSGRAVFHSIWIGVVVALVCGLGFWLRLQKNNNPVFGLAISDWLALTPVITWLAGTSVLLIAKIFSGERK